MTVSYVTYELQDGYIMNWLAAGPQAIPVHELPADDNNSLKLQIARQFYDKKSGIDAMPVEQGPLTEGIFKIGDYEGRWSYYRCLEDRFVDHSAAYPTCQFLRSWAYTQLNSPVTQAIPFTLTAFGPVDVWVNKKNVCHNEEFSSLPRSVSFEAELKEGKNQVLVRFAGVAAPEKSSAGTGKVMQAIALRVNADGISTRIPTLIPSLERRSELEAVNEQIYIDQDIYGIHDKISVYWPKELEKQSFQDVRLQTTAGRIYGQAEDLGKPGGITHIGVPASLPEGPFQILIMPRSWEYYDSNIRIIKTINLWSLGSNKFSEEPSGTIEERRRQGLIKAARRENDIFAEIAKMILDYWQDIEEKTLAQSFGRINQRQAGSEIELLGLLGAVARLGRKAKFSQQLKTQVKEAALGFRYNADEHPSGCDTLDFARESRQIIFAACQILAGQLYGSDTFTASGLTGKQLRKQGEEQAVAWMQRRGMQGFMDWDSTAGYAETLMALSYLIDVAKTDAVWELASVLMDKMFYAIALNSFRGVFGSSQGRASEVRSGLLEETSPLTRLMWGQGVYNHHTAALVSLASLKNYELPPILSDIAAAQPAEIWNREHQALEGQQVDKVMYRTPDYMLASAQDYRPGEHGQREHIWQATLGPQCVVFTNHPANASVNEAAAPNFWLGNDVLPRVCQWKNTLVALYNLPENAWMDYTHAYFPTRTFDEYVIRGNTAFARKEDGYLALTASQGLELVQTGHAAFRELRSTGRQAAWICQMGRAELDGTFAAFQERILAEPPTFHGLNVRYRNPHGETITFRWEGPLSIDGKPQPLHGFPHFENPYTTTQFPSAQMEVKTEDYILGLNFGNL